jgi:hypothetical protein
MPPGFAGGQTATAVKEPLVVVRKGLYGYIDHDGNTLIEPQFYWAGGFEDGYGTAYVCGRYVLVDKTGKVLSMATPHGGPGLMPKKINGKIEFVDRAGMVKIKPMFDNAMPFSDGVAAVKTAGLWGFIDENGHFVVPPRFDDAFYFHEGVGVVQSGDTTELIDKSGRILAAGYDVTGGVIAEGRIPVGRDDKYGYLDLHGAVAIPLRFDDALTYSEGLAAVKKGSKWGYIDTNGSTAIPFQFDFAGEFGNGLAPVRRGAESGFINHSGVFVFNLEFEYVAGFGSSEADDVSQFWTKAGDFGYVNTSGRVIWGPIPEPPDHPLITGWSEEGKRASCNVVSDAIRQAVMALPADDDQ